MSKERELLARVLTSELWSVQEELQAEIKKLLAQPEEEQEPVAWMYWNSTIGTWTFHRTNIKEIAGLPCEPLYTSPPTREPLDNVEIMTIAAEHTWDLKSFARAIEKAHGIGLDE